MALKERTHGPVRRTGHRRKQQVQRRANEAIQIVEALDSAIQEAMDIDWNSRPQRPNGPLWADLYLGLRTSTGSVYYALPTKLFHSIRLWRLHMESSTERLPENYRTNRAPSTPALVSGLPRNARTNKHERYSGFTTDCLKDLQGRGKRIHK